MQKKTLFFTSIVSAFIVPLCVHAQLSLPNSTYGLVDATPKTVISNVINAILVFIGTLALLMIVVSGVMYVTSGGDSNRTETAKKYLMYSVIGLVVTLLAYVIVVFVGEALGL